MKLIVASNNAHKVAELDAILSALGFEVCSLKEAGLHVEPEETGETFEENSYIKAKATLAASGCATVADDSGLMVEALGGAPGVYSARFAGEHATDEENNEKLMSLMEGIPDGRRQAKFVSVITLMYPDGRILTARGECPGTIGRVPEGTNGFGYDPLFLPEGYSVTYAQLTAEEKNRISHRAKALEILRRRLESEE